MQSKSPESSNYRTKHIGKFVKMAIGVLIQTLTSRKLFPVPGNPWHGFIYILVAVGIIELIVLLSLIGVTIVHNSWQFLCVYGSLTSDNEIHTRRIRKFTQFCENPPTRSMVTPALHHRVGSSGQILKDGNWSIHTNTNIL
jgi:hypothetical protein